MSDKHRVLLFGQKVFGSAAELAVEYCDIELSPYPKYFHQLENLYDYDLIILDYAAFSNGREIYAEHQEYFEKQMLVALNRGANFCILHDNELGYTGDGTKYDTCMREQIGFRWLSKVFGQYIYVLQLDQPIISMDVKRSEFRDYQEHWGASKNLFDPKSDEKFDDIILMDDQNKGCIGFTIQVSRGKIVYLPFQRDFPKPGALEACLESLVSSLISYLTHSTSNIPLWAETNFFPQEEQLYHELEELQSRLEATKSQVQPFQEAKSIAFLREYDFEDAVPKFFQSRFGLRTERKETYKEDFWILGENSQKILIAETKTHDGGIKRQDITKLDMHRTDNKLDDTFPALLIVNAHLKANSWKDKLRKVDKQDYEVAAQFNVLIVRIEDLLFFWNLIVEGKKSSEELLRYFLTEKGWMEVQQDGTITIHK